MTKLFTIILISVLFLSLTRSISADEIAGSSAAIKAIPFPLNLDNVNDPQKIYKIKKAIQNVLKKYDSPLVTEIDSFIDACMTYKLDCYLLPSIAGLESTFGKFISPNSYNPFGWGGGYIKFNNWRDGILTVAGGLRNNYINKGAQSIDDIGNIYAESPTWSTRVQYFMNSFRQEEAKLELFLSMNQVKL